MSFRRVAFCALLLAAGTGCDDGPSGGPSSDLATAKRAVAVVSACEGEPVNSPWTGMLFDAALDGTSAFHQVATCIAKAQDCTGILTCKGLTPEAGCPLGEMSGSFCDGHDMVECRNPAGWGRRTSCGALACVDEGWLHCEGATGCELAPRCDGNVLVTCDVVGEGSEDCGEKGLACLRGAGGAPYCGDGIACESNYCDGDVVVQCASGFEQGRRPCDLVHPAARCSEMAGSAYCGIPPEEAECSAGDALCVGTVARFCVGGGWLDVDCATFVGSTCSDTEGLLCVMR